MGVALWRRSSLGSLQTERCVGAAITVDGCKCGGGGGGTGVDGLGWIICG